MAPMSSTDLHVISGDSADGPRPVHTLTGRELADELSDLATQFDTLEQRRFALLGEFDARAEHRHEGAATASSWLAQAAHLPRSHGSALVRDARKLRECPRTQAAIARIGTAKARIILRAYTPDTAEAFERDELECLLTPAETLTADQTAQLVRYWLAVNRPDGPEPEPTGHLHAGLTADNVLDLSGTVVGTDATFCLNLLDSIAEDIRKSEKECDDGRPPSCIAQRRAQALVEIFIRASVAHDTAHPARPLIAIKLDADWFTNLMGEPPVMDRYGLLTRPEAETHLCEANLMRVLMKGDSEILDLGHTNHDPNRALRRAIAFRDGGCTMCHRPALVSHIHHAVFWQHGGPTNLNNCVMLCGTHHRMIHAGLITCTPLGKGKFRFTTADGREIPQHPKLRPAPP